MIMAWRHMEHDQQVADATFWATTHWLYYLKIKPEERGHVGQHHTAAYAARSTLYRVKPGDVLWFVNVFNGHLYLLGRLAVEFVLDDTAIAQELVDSPLVWEESDWYAIANRYHVEPLREVDITALAGLLRFTNGEQDHLTVVNAQVVKPQELIGLRRLATESAVQVETAWYDDAYIPQTMQDYLELTEDDQAYAEGQVVVRTVKQRRRNQQLVMKAKETFRKQNDGRLYCEACGFDFNTVYGVDYIEAHHLVPISSLENEQENTISALVLLCANCHRMIHSRTPPLSLEELKELIANS